MKIIGLTGGIGMGKSTAAAVFRRARIPVFDADAAVHRLQARGGRGVAPIEAAFPGTVRNGAVDRAALREAVLGKPEALRRLEHILHPLVRQEERAFLARARRAGESGRGAGHPAVVRNRMGHGVDQVVVVSAPRAVQMQRVRKRRKMSTADIAAVIARQMPDAEKAPPRRYGGPHRTVAASRATHTAPPDQDACAHDPLGVVRYRNHRPGAASGHRVIEVAALELINDLPTGRHFHALIDPERDIPDDATRIHGFTNGALAGKPKFAEIAGEMLAFFATGPLIAHNAPFDFGFLNAEFARLGLPRLDRRA